MLEYLRHRFPGPGLLAEPWSAQRWTALLKLDRARPRMLEQMRWMAVLIWVVQQLLLLLLLKLLLLLLELLLLLLLLLMLLLLDVVVVVVVVVIVPRRSPVFPDGRRRLAGHSRHATALPRGTVRLHAVVRIRTAVRRTRRLVVVVRMRTVSLMVRRTDAFPIVLAAVSQRV